MMAVITAVDAGWCCGLLGGGELQVLSLATFDIGKCRGGRIWRRTKQLVGRLSWVSGARSALMTCEEVETVAAGAVGFD